MSINNKLLLQIKLAVAIALADKEFSDSEIKSIKKWYENRILDRSSREKNKLLNDLEDELIKLKELEESDELELEDVFYDLNNIDDRSFKYEALDLSIEVMVADSSIHPKEVELIDKIVDQLDLNHATAKKYIRNQILKLDKPPKNIDLEGLLKINPTISNKDSQKLIRLEFDKWNSASTSGQTANQRKNAQVMIDIISKTRERYV
jgi:hypothetical protein